MDDTYKCICGEKFKQKKSLEIHNKKTHWDAISEAVDQDKSDKKTSAI